MIFSTLPFFAFFAAYFALHLAIPLRYRYLLIILGSTFFYAWWKIEYTWLPFLLTGIAYGGVLLVRKQHTRRARRVATTATVIALFVPLVVFKYTNFVYQQVLGPVFGFHDSLFTVSLPLGVSFITFTLVAYVVDIYRGRFKGPRPPSIILSYVLFFPHLIAGPILRPDELVPQLERPRAARLRRLTVPLAIFTLGLFKKLVFADPLAAAVDPVFSSGGQTLITGPQALLAIYGFTVQIYCDFSGYTDMALGVALALGVHLPGNFRQPFAATSLVDLWRRWHITLSFWLRDYLFIPLSRIYRNFAWHLGCTVFTMTVCGLWHGAGWHFVAWGAMHGIGLAGVYVFRRVARNFRFRQVPNWLGRLMTFHYFAFAIVFFRAPNMDKAFQIFHALLFSTWHDLPVLLSTQAFTLVILVVFALTHRYDDHRRVKVAVRYLRKEILWPALALMWILAVTLSQGSSAQFIYFEF